MANIKAFRAIRPVRDKVHLVATRPYYSYKKNVLKAKLEDNPFTFLHIINPEFHTKIKTDANSTERFIQVKSEFDSFVDQGVLIQDQSESLYIYRQSVNGHQFTGVVAGASVEEYDRDSIKKHEATLTERENMFCNYLDVTGFNAEPVLMSYQSNTEIQGLLERECAKRPEYEFTTTDRIKHELWILDQNASDLLTQYFKAVDSLYIADGHHRSASSVALNKRRMSLGTHTNNSPYFLSFLIDENELKILEFNRLVSTLNGLTHESFLEKLKLSFDIENIKGAQKPEKEHDFTMCLDGDWYRVTCKEQVIDHSHPVKCLDAEILTNYILSPILGIHDLKTDDRIRFVSGAEPLKQIETQIVSGKNRVAFILYPVTMDQVKKVADNQLIMPPKSTWVEPKLRSGLTIYPINE